MQEAQLCASRKAVDAARKAVVDLKVVAITGCSEYIANRRLVLQLSCSSSTHVHHFIIKLVWQPCGLGSPARTVW